MTRIETFQKSYRADDTLINILNAQGLTETRNRDLNGKNKRYFKTSTSSKKKLFFDRATIQVWNGITLQDSFLELSEHEVKLVLLFFKLKSNDLNELTLQNRFTIKKASERLRFLEGELDQLKELKILLPRRKKIERILREYEEIN